MTPAVNPYASPETTELVPQSDEDPPSVPKLFSFEGRLGRMRLVAYLFVPTLLTVPLAFAALMLASELPALGFGGYAIVLLAHTVFTVSVYVRRLHDLDQPGLLMLLLLVPLVNLLLLAYLFFFRGTEGSNHYGAPTVPNSAGVKAAFGFGLAFLLLVPILAAIAIPAFTQYVERAQQSQLP
jgi:uncharacterized membrane protein YhaH (DUF805 family)